MGPDWGEQGQTRARTNGVGLEGWDGGGRIGGRTRGRTRWLVNFPSFTSFC